MNIKKEYIISIILVIAAIAISSTPVKPVTYSSASWHMRYDNIEDLFAKSDVVVIGVVQSSSSYVGESNIIYTDHVFRVDEVLLGSPESKITILQTGGITEEKHVEIEDDPLLDKNDVHVMFLREYKDGHYCSLGGPQGHFVTKNGKIYSIGEIDQRASLTTSLVHTKGISLAQLETSKNLSK